MNYSSDDGHESVSLSQSAASDQPLEWREQLTSGDGWEDVIREGAAVRVRKPGPQAQAHLERDGTFVFLMSETLTSEQLAAIAAGLKPAPSTSSI